MLALCVIPYYRFGFSKAISSIGGNSCVILSYDMCIKNTGCRLERPPTLKPHCVLCLFVFFGSRFEGQRHLYRGSFYGQTICCPLSFFRDKGAYSEATQKLSQAGRHQVTAWSTLEPPSGRDSSMSRRHAGITTESIT